MPTGSVRLQVARRLSRRLRPRGCALGGLAAALLLTLVGCAYGETRSEEPSELLAAAKSFKRYRLYHLGSSFEGLR